MTAKCLAYSLKTSVLAINHLELLAWQAIQDNVVGEAVRRIRPVIRAQRGQVFAGMFQIAPSGLARIEPDQLLQQSDFEDSLANDDLIVANQDTLSRCWPDESGSIGDSQAVKASASTVGRLAIEKREQGESSDLWSIQPLYYKPSYAEEAKIRLG